MKVFNRIENTSRLIIGLVVTFSLINVTTTYLAEKSVDASIAGAGRRLQVLEAANMLLKGGDNLTAAARAYAATGDQKYKTAYQTELTVTRLRERATEQLRELGTAQEEMDLIEQANRGSAALAELENRAFKAADAGDVKKALALVYGIEYQTAKENATSPLAEAYTEIETRHTQEVKSLTARANMMSRIADIALGLNILTALTGLLYYFRKRVVGPVVQLSQQTQRLLSGDRTVRLGYLKEGSEVGDLARSLDAYHKANEQTEQMRITKTHIATISSALQRATSLSELSRCFFSGVAPLIELGMGGFYRLDHERGALVLCGGYAREGGEKLDNEIALGDGLVGECALSKRVIVIADPPQDYIRISSVLGAAHPKAITLFPIINNDRLLGIIELASFENFVDKDMALLDGLLPVIAMCMEIVERNESTRQLLAATQEQAAELESQQGRIQTMLSEQDVIFNNAPMGILYTGGGRIRRANNAMAALFGMSLENYVGAETSIMFVSPENYREFGAKVGAKLASGDGVHLEWEFVRASGDKFWSSVSARGVQISGMERAAIWILEDISERKQLEQSMKESEARLRSILENSPVGCTINTEEGVAIFQKHDIASPILRS
ncbi:MAG: PAS domain S-box protein [Syntrophales bacterium]